MGTADKHLSTCLRASVAHNTVAVHPLQSSDQSDLETFSFRFVSSRFCFPVFYFSISVSFLFERIFTFPFQFSLTESLFFR